MMWIKLGSDNYWNLNSVARLRAIIDPAKVGLPEWAVGLATLGSGKETPLNKLDYDLLKLEIEKQTTEK